MTPPGWPADWSDRLVGKGCPLCAAVGGGDNDHSVYLWTGRCAEARLQRHTSVAGYCIVVWNAGHVAEPTDLEPAMAASYWRDVMDVGQAIRDVFRPMKINYMTLGNTVPHLHTHVFPRLEHDPAPGGPISWEALTGVPATPEERLREQATALRAVSGRP